MKAVVKKQAYEVLSSSECFRILVPRTLLAIFAQRKKRIEYMTMLTREPASTRRIKFSGPLSEVATLFAKSVLVNHRAGNITRNAMLEPAGMKRIHPAISRVKAMLHSKQRKASRLSWDRSMSRTLASKSSYLRAKRSK